MITLTDQPSLLDLLDAPAEDDSRHQWVHVVMPTMGYACGGDMIDGLPNGGPPGKWHLGGWGRPQVWDEVITCPECKGPGRRTVAMWAHRQQSPAGHICDETCWWTAIPAEVAA